MTNRPSNASGLEGHLEDLPLIDMLQIAAFSKKTGYLRLEGPRGRGGIVFREGLVVCAYSWSTLKYLKQIGDDPQGGHNVAILEKQIEISLAELATLKEGRFHFQVTRSVPTELEGMPVAAFLLEDGINPEGLLLELAKDMDQQRRETSELLQSHSDSVTPETTEETADSDTTRTAEQEADDPVECVLVVDDEPPVRETVGEALREAGYRVYTASSPAEGMGIASEVALSGKRLLVVTDLGMPTTSGRSFRGGFELVRSLRRSGLLAPVLLMTERISSKARTRAKTLGIEKVAMKPALSKLDPSQYEKDLKKFAKLIIRLLQSLGTTAPVEEDTVPSGGGEDKASAPFLDYIASMTEQLIRPRGSVDVSKLVLEVASKYLDRGILFVIKAEKAIGIAGFGFVSTEQASTEVARNITFNVDQARPFAEVAYSGKPKRFSAELDGLQVSLYSAISRGRATECVLLPMLNNGEVLVILYGDNAGSGRSIGKLRGLELFIGQASMILENTYLHRKLRAFEAKFDVTGQSAPMDVRG